MQEIAELLKNKDLTKKKTSWRSEMLEPCVKIINEERKMARWKEYIKWLRENRIKNSKETQDKFRKTAQFKRLRDENLIHLVILTAHIKEKEDLHYLVSISKDSKMRGKGFGKVFYGSLKTCTKIRDMI